MRLDAFTFSGLSVGLRIDTTEEPTTCLLEYRNHKTSLDSYRSDRLQVTAKDSIIVGFSALFFRSQGRDVEFYSSQSTVLNLLGEPVEVSQVDSALFRRVFSPQAQAVKFHQEGLVCWRYGEAIELFFTKFDPLEGFKFPDYQFWSIAVGDLWIPPV